MARIRTIKPELFRHEILQDLEAANPSLHPMLVFIALFTQCDKNGVFEWRPRQLALDILPFLWQGSNGEALGKSLMLLRENGFISQLFHGEKRYGCIPTFREHQRVSGKELTEPSKHPEPAEMTEEKSGEAIGKHRGSTGEAPEKQPVVQEGKGRERERKGMEGGDLEAEAQRLKSLHLNTCGLTSLPPLAIIREILQAGKPASKIEDIYQMHGGDPQVWRQRNIVEKLKDLRDGEDPESEIQEWLNS